MYRSLATTLLISFLLLAALVTPAFGISVSYTAGDGSSAVSSWSFHLDDANSLREETMLGSDRLYQRPAGRGTGSNSISSSREREWLPG
jgi:hypothetical protein